VRILKKIIKSPITQTVIAAIAFAYIWIIFKTCRFEIIYPKGVNIDKYNSQKAIYIFWHGRLLVLPHFHPSKICTWGVISTHSDGAIISKIVRFSGIRNIAGSTNRQSTKAFRGIVSKLNAGNTVMLTPDGPRGPRMRINSNIASIAKMTGVPIIPITYSASKCKILGSWDKFLFPYPFCNISIIYGTPAHVPKDITKEKINILKSSLEIELNKITKKADEKVGITPIEHSQ
jgi:lysophospholipid acyltransferase (LPLAT)-like uncharacterized protein